MKIEFDNTKNQHNIELRGLAFIDAGKLEWSTTMIWRDERFVYGEERFSALAYLNRRLHFVAFTFIDEGIRVISFRKANKREIKTYELQQ